MLLSGHAHAHTPAKQQQYPCLDQNLLHIADAVRHNTCNYKYICIIISYTTFGGVGSSSGLSMSCLQ